MEALLDTPSVKHRTIPAEEVGGSIWADGYWVDLEDLVHGGIDGEEFMGTGTAFDTDEAGPVYTPAGS